MLRAHGSDEFKITASYYPNISRSTLIDIETKFIIEENCMSPFGYNEMQRGSCKPPDYRMSSETCKKISKALTGRKQSASHVFKRAELLRGRKHSEKTRSNMLASWTDIRRASQSKRLTGQPKSVEMVNAQSARMRSKSIIYDFFNAITNETFRGITIEFTEAHALNYKSAITTFKRGYTYKGWIRS